MQLKREHGSVEAGEQEKNHRMMPASKVGLSQSHPRYCLKKPDYCYFSGLLAGVSRISGSTDIGIFAVVC
ncbi:MAG: hypothetical protein PHF37_04970 [Phycisphaerae bacterium]|nr:hypothetical protein [Phycisphaerae bacterium]